MRCRLDPELFVETMYPWGKPHTPLANRTGPRKWQRKILRRIREHLLKNEELDLAGLIAEVMFEAVSSGHGSGKSALVAWLVHWFLSTRLGGCVQIAANSEDQLRFKTFAEISKWFTMGLNSHWFEVEGVTVRPAAWFAKQLKEQLGIDSKGYYAHGNLWNESRPEGFQGTHNDVGVMWIFDEGSGIPKVIWESVNPGSFTEKTKSRFFFVFSNFTRNEGPFHELFYGDPADPWHTETIDVRDVEDMDHAAAHRLVAKLGENHDQVRVRVRGLPPQSSEETFIPAGIARASRLRRVDADRGAAKVLGIDPATRGGTTSATFRVGRKHRTVTNTFTDTGPCVTWLAGLIDDEEPDAIFCDAGQGTGVIDGLRALGYKVIEVWFSEPADEPERYADRRTENWGRMRDWLPEAELGDDEELEGQLVAPRSEWVGRAESIEKLESKKSMRGRGIPSPDKADSLSLTFTKPVARLDAKMRKKKRRAETARDLDHEVIT